MHFAYDIHTASFHLVKDRQVVLTGDKAMASVISWQQEIFWAHVECERWVSPSTLFCRTLYRVCLWEAVGLSPMFCGLILHVLQFLLVSLYILLGQVWLISRVMRGWCDVGKPMQSALVLLLGDLASHGIYQVRSHKEVRDSWHFIPYFAASFAQQNSW